MSSINGHRGRLACLVLWLAAAASGTAQTEQTGIQMETSLFNFVAGDNSFLSVIVTELGTPTADSQVQIVYRNAVDAVVARSEGVLRRGQPVVFDVPLSGPKRRLLLRASITIVGPPGRGSTPVVVMEDVHPGSFTIGERFSCSAPASREGPVTPYCPGGVVTNITIG